MMLQAVGIDTNGTKPLDGVSHWKNFAKKIAGPAPRNEVVIGNSTDTCGQECGFGLLVGNWKYLRGGGGLPSSWVPTPNLTTPTNNCQGLHLANTGPNSRHIVNSSVADCCDACGKTNGCVLWAFNAEETTCYLKTKLGQFSEDSRWTSGVPPTPSPSPPPPPPSPPPPPPTPGSLLFDVISDPSEAHNLLPSQKTVVANMSKRLDQVLESYTQAKDDPACPFTGWNKTKGEQYMGPW